MRTLTPRCPPTPQSLSPLPIPYSPPILGFGNQVRSAEEALSPLGFPLEGWLVQRGVPGNVVPVDFILGETPKRSTAVETGGFLTSNLLSHCPCPWLIAAGKAGRDSTSHSHTPVSPPTTATSNAQGCGCVSIAVTLINYLVNSAQCKMKGFIFLVVVPDAKASGNNSHIFKLN